MTEQLVHGRLGNIATADTIDWPEALQRLANIVSSYTPTYAGNLARSVAWAGLPASQGGISQMADDPEALQFRNTATGAWMRLTPQPLSARGSIGLTWADAATTSDTKTVTFPVAFSSPPMVILSSRIFFTSLNKYIDPMLVDSPTATSFKVRATLSVASSGGGTIQVPWVAL